MTLHKKTKSKAIPKTVADKPAPLTYLASIERDAIAKARQLMQLSSRVSTPKLPHLRFPEQLKRWGLASQAEVNELRQRIEALESALLRYACGDKTPPLSARQTLQERSDTLPRS